MNGQYPMIVPKSETPQGVLVYSAEDINRFTPETGAQANFYQNGASPCRPNEFGLKAFACKWEANCAYERQKLAAKHLLAPPVGKMFQVRRRNNKILFWGYQTAIAIQIPEDGLTFLKLFPTEESQWQGPTRLRWALRRISVGGLPANDLTPKGRKCATPIRGRAKWCLGGDLHSWNVMMWEDEHGSRPVCIDFGYHSVLQSSRGQIVPVYDYAVDI